MLISQRFSFACRIRFTLPFRETITIGATACSNLLRSSSAESGGTGFPEAGDKRARPRPTAYFAFAQYDGQPSSVAVQACAGSWAGNDQSNCWGVKSARHDLRRQGKRGRRRTRQDQISLGHKIAGEIADPKDPHRTKKTCFFCRTGFREERTLRKYDPAV